MATAAPAPMQEATHVSKPKELTILVETLIYLTMFNEGVQVYLIYPVLNTTVMYFLEQSDGLAFANANIGTYSSLLSSAFYASSAISGFGYGYIADRFGRRVAVLGGLFGSCFAGVMLGFSVNYYMAVAARFLTGLLDANLAMLKAYMGDVTDRTNQSRVFSNSMFMFALAVTLCPFLGTFLGGLQLTSTVFLPLFWPAIVSSSLTFAIGIMCFLYLPETQKWLKQKKASPAAKEAGIELGSGGVRQESFCTRYRSELIAILFYAWMSWVLYGSETAFPMLVEKPWGLQLEHEWSGYFLAAQGASWCFFQVFIFPLLVRKIGVVNVFRIGSFMLMTGVSMVFLPSVFSSSWIQKPLMFLALFVRGSSMATTFTGIIMIVNNSTTTATKGVVTGLAHSFSNLARMLGTLVTGKLVDAGGQINFHYLPFMAASLLCAAMMFASTKLPRSLDIPRSDTKVDIPADTKC